MTSKSSHHHRVVHVFFPDGRRGWLPKCLSPGKWNEVTKWVGGGTNHSRYGVFKLHPKKMEQISWLVNFIIAQMVCGWYRQYHKNIPARIFWNIDETWRIVVSKKNMNRLWWPTWSWEKEYKNDAMSLKFQGLDLFVRCLEKVKQRNSTNDGLPGNSLWPFWDG